MHPTFFAVKRVYWQTLAATWPLVKPFALTPARFDLMRIVVHHAEGIAQRTIQWLLGVSAPVVSRMVTSLVKMGYLTRYRGVDQRCSFVELTDSGREALRGAMAAAVESHVADQITARAVLGEKSGGGGALGDLAASLIDRARPALAALDEVLAKMRAALGDPAPFVHPWRGGDFVPLEVNEWYGMAAPTRDVDLLFAPSQSQ